MAVAAVSCCCCVFCWSLFIVLFFTSVILLVNWLIKADMTAYLIYKDSVTRIRSSCGLFLCSWLTCDIAIDCFWPRSGKQERSCFIPHVPDVGRIWAENMLLSGMHL